MFLSEIIFWISLSVIIYCYAGYGLLLYLINSIKEWFSDKPLIEFNNEQPEVTFIIPVYNEEEILEQKIRNTLGLNYPADKLNIIFITDGSVDGSVNLVKKFPNILLLHLSERKGKSAAINRAMRYVKTPLVVFTDANSILNKNSLSLLVTHFANPEIGGVAGEKKIVNPLLTSVGKAEGFYWRYESFLKKQDAGFYSVVGAAGELFAIRTHLFKPIDDDIILDDFMISVQVCLQGYRFAYEPLAFAMETPSVSLCDEKLRKTRIAAGAFQSISILSECMNIFKHSALSFQYISRRLLRWVVCPILLLVIFILNSYLGKISASPVYFYLLIMQSVFYFISFSGWLLIRYNRIPGWLTFPFYFVFMNMCLFNGFFNFINNRHSVLWKKSLRQAWE